MGNIFKKFPRPAEINFPAVQKKNWNFSLCSRTGGSEKKFASFFCLLKSGNILILYKKRDEEQFNVKSFLEIYNVPDLKLIEKYEYYKEQEDTFYVLDFAMQSKKGNIFTIGDKLYVFNGEEISKGPEEKSEEINDIYLGTAMVEFCKPSDKRQRHPFTKKSKIFSCSFLLEVKEDLFLYTDKIREDIFLLDISKQKVERTEHFHMTKLSKYNQPWKYKLDMILRSEYYPENLYIYANIKLPGDIYDSKLLVFNLEQFLKQKSPIKEPLFTIEVSKSQYIMALCEYDKKYILLDSYKDGIYIVDMESKQKVAVCVPKLYIKESNSFYNIYADRKTGSGEIYKKMIKLKDGQVLLETCYTTDIREQICEQKIKNLNIINYELFGEYLIMYCIDTSIIIFKISN